MPNGGVESMIESILRHNLIFNWRIDFASLNMHDLIPLKHLRPGNIASVGQLVGKPDEVHRLEELGLRQGTRIEMLQPGSPCIIRVSGNKLCFRDSDAFHVLVRTGDVP